MLPKEDRMETLIEQHLLLQGYKKGESKEFDIKYCIFKDDLFEFFMKTQGDLLEEYKALKGAKWQKILLDAIDSNIKKRGLIDVLKNGIKDNMMNEKFELLYKKVNLESKQNIFNLTRQLRYSDKNTNEIDLVIALNGFPIVCIELKNQFTGQNVYDAIKQYKNDRSSKEKLFEFNKRVIVYFAADKNEVYMTTKLKDEGTLFLPFNTGNNNGKGNPVVEGKLSTYYLWEKILAKGSLIDIIINYCHLEKREDDIELIFPRYHQIDAIREMVSSILSKDARCTYLIQHSAGSGKTKTIAWTSHILANLINTDSEGVFDSIIIVTDRKVLDKQLRNEILDIEHKEGLVEVIDDKNKSRGLAEAINKKRKIIITTIQKFQHALPSIKNTKNKKFAIIIDEAHSSTEGEYIDALKNSLNKKSTTKDGRQDIEEAITERIAALLENTGSGKNLTFFAFTATPKNKTLHIFGVKKDDGNSYPFHLYSMKQAIQEKYIIDVLKNYMEVKSYFNLRKKINDNPKLNSKKAKVEIGNFISANDMTIKAKSEMIIKDFSENRIKWLNEEAKAMIVTSGREEAVKYKLEIDEYIKKLGYSFKTLVAFTDKVTLDGVKYTEYELNKKTDDDIKLSNLTEIFKKKEVKILIVADKYQTGFNEEKLCVMYIDKKLTNLNAVQTLSRLNRQYLNKETFILDFKNKAEEIQKAFRPYYEDAKIESFNEPEIINKLYEELKQYNLYTNEEVSEFSYLCFVKDRSFAEDVKMDNIIDIVIDRLNNTATEIKEVFLLKAKKYIQFYKFISNIYPINNINLLKLKLFLIGLLKKVEKCEVEKFNIKDMVELEYYKLEKLADEINGKDISLNSSNNKLSNMSKNFNTTNTNGQESKYFSDIIDELNEKFALNLNKDDAEKFYDVEKEYSNDDELKAIAGANSYEDFKSIFIKMYSSLILVKIKNKDDKLLKIIIEKEGIKNRVIDHFASRIYDNANLPMMIRH